MNSKQVFPVIQIASLNFSQFSGLSYVGKEYLKQNDSISWQSNFEEANENIIFEWEVFNNSPYKGMVVSIPVVVGLVLIYHSLLPGIISSSIIPELSQRVALT
jgi:hypothetical protein